MTDSNFPKIFVVILNYNGSTALPACLSSVFQSDYPNFEVVVVDNASKDESFEQARLNFSRAHLIKNSENVGFSKGNNVGIRYALEKFADFVFVLNNDTVIERTTLSVLMTTAAENPTTGIISPLILAGDNKTVWFAGGKIDWQKMKTVHLTEEISQPLPSSDYLSGCAMLINKAVFKKIGLFDERFFLYYEDADFSLRAKKAGFELLIAPSAHIKHLEQSNQNSSKTYWLVLSGLLFFKLHASLAQKIWIFIYLLLRKIKNFYKLRVFHDQDAREVHKAYQDFKKLPQ